MMQGTYLGALVIAGFFFAATFFFIVITYAPLYVVCLWGRI